MTLAEQLYGMMQKSMDASLPADFCVGTVVSAEPLEISISTMQAPLRRSVLVLTEPVVEKKIPILQHTHSIRDTYTGGGSCGDALLQGQILCTEFGDPLPVENGYIILNRALAAGDKVVLLRVNHGQRYLVLSRIFEG